MGSYLAQDTSGRSSTTETLLDPRPDAACKRLRESRDQQDACEAIREIVSNLIGCEEMALFQVTHSRKRFSMIWSFGIERGKVHLPKLLSESALSEVIAGHAYIRDGFGVPETAEGEKARAFVPIRFNGETAAVLVLLRLLPQKTKIDVLDRELFAVISREAGKPLFSAASRGRQNLKGSDD